MDFQSYGVQGPLKGLGGVAGVIYGHYSEITNVRVTGTLTETWEQSNSIGGIVGSVHANGSVTISNCSFSGNIDLGAHVSYVGGIIGNCTGAAVVENCYTAGIISRPYGEDPIGYLNSPHLGKIAGCADNIKFSKCTSSMVIDAISRTGAWAGHHGDQNTYSIVRSNDSANKVAVFNIKGDFQAAKVNLVEIVLSYDATNYDVTAVNAVNGATVESVRVENGTVKLLIGVTNLDTIANNGEETIAVVTVTPKTGKTPAQAEISITSFKGWEVLNDGITVAEVALAATSSVATSAFDYTVPGDANNDGVVTAADLSLVLYYYGYTVDQLPAGINVDVNGDGIVNMADVTIIVNLIF